jgi:hypothetical protein
MPNITLTFYDLDLVQQKYGIEGCDLFKNLIYCKLFKINYKSYYIIYQGDYIYGEPDDNLRKYELKLWEKIKEDRDVIVDEVYLDQ